MAKPRIFISSTFEDLKDVRSEVSNFIDSQGYEPVSFEKSDITFGPNETLEDSCGDEVRNCSMLILIIRDRLGSISKEESKSNVSYNSITRNEYLEARRHGLPIFVFIHSNTHNEYKIYKSQKNSTDMSFNFIKNKELILFIDEIYNEDSFRFIYQYDTSRDILKQLRKQWAGLFNKYLKNAISYANRSKEKIPINAFKLFFFRRSLGISQAKLSERASLKEYTIQRIEDAGIKKSHIEVEDFVSISHEDAQRIADSLQCTIGNIKAGLPDDFLSQYLAYYFKNKGTSQRQGKHSKQKNVFNTKVVLFDFDGTMTKREDNLTSWEKIWLKLGYDLKECGELHGKFSNFQISHKEWCKITEKKFKAKGLKNTDLDKIADEIELIEGVKDVIGALFEHNIKMYILSGSIRYIIKNALGDVYNLFEMVKANEINFDGHGHIKNIVGTKYDFEGKGRFIRQIIEEDNIHPMEAFYIGNSINDEWAHESGAQTLCVNPRMTNPYHPIQWMYCIQKMDNFKEILQYMNFEEKLFI